MNDYNIVSVVISIWWVQMGWSVMLKYCLLSADEISGSDVFCRCTSFWASNVRMRIYVISDWDKVITIVWMAMSSLFSSDSHLTYLTCSSLAISAGNRPGCWYAPLSISTSPFGWPLPSTISPGPTSFSLLLASLAQYGRPSVFLARVSRLTSCAQVIWVDVCSVPTATICRHWRTFRASWPWTPSPFSPLPPSLGAFFPWLTIRLVAFLSSASTSSQPHLALFCVLLPQPLPSTAISWDYQVPTRLFSSSLTLASAFRRFCFWQFIFPILPV